MRVLPYFVILLVVMPLSARAFSPDTIAKAVRHFFPGEPLMVEVARCESGLRQFDASGKPLRGGLGGAMIGLFQFHEKYHRSAALALGYDLDTLLGNIAYARVLYRAQGLTPWESSRHCWGSEIGKLENQKTTKLENPEALETTKLTKTLRYGMTDPEVRRLQLLLRAAGYPVTGPGEETSYFGVATYKALLAFQCAKALACLSNPLLRSGAGIVDERTRSALRS